MDFLANNFMKPINEKRAEFKKQMDENIMKVPFLKLHMNNNSCAINKNNQALTPEEQNNL